jgi:glycosyltransferase involved in cell wall biosynthesis
VLSRLSLFQQKLGPLLGWIELPPGFLLSVVIPVYNERATVEEIVRRVEAVPIPKEIILVDDGSTDGTREILVRWEKRPGFRVLFHESNRGKGAAIRSGLAVSSGDVVLIQDADLEYDPIHYPELIYPIVSGVADVVYGSRFLPVGPHRVLYFWHAVANWIITMLSNMFTDLNLTDVETCYKAFRGPLIREIAPTLKENRFGFEIEITAKVARRRCRIYEVGISYFGRTYAEGKKIRLRDAFRAVWCILRYWRWD